MQVPSLDSIGPAFSPSLCRHETQLVANLSGFGSPPENSSFSVRSAFDARLLCVSGHSLVDAGTDLT
jgi:hypothetical protein